MQQWQLSTRQCRQACRWAVSWPCKPRVQKNEHGMTVREHAHAHTHAHTRACHWSVRRLKPWQALFSWQRCTWQHTWVVAATCERAWQVA